jgi:hypothetical protein
MSEMVERVARAMCKEAFGDCVCENECRSADCQDKKRYALAAIEAMREPTQQMRLAGISEWSRSDPTPEHESTLIFNAIWRAMLDAALSPEQTAKSNK